MNKFIILTLIFAIVGCAEKAEDSIDFLDPQPIGVKNQTLFNKKYRGVYLNAEDSSMLRIEDHTIIRSSTNPCVFAIHDIDSSITVDRSDIKALETALSEYYTLKIIKIENDSIYGFMSVVDTIFSISENNICRFYKGSYFLNYSDDNVIWKVKRLDLNKKTLSIGMIIPTDSLFNIYPIQNKYSTQNTYIIENDSAVTDSIVNVNYTIAPTKKELKKMIKNNFFTEWEVWVKEQ